MKLQSSVVSMFWSFPPLQSNNHLVGLGCMNAGSGLRESFPAEHFPKTRDPLNTSPKPLNPKLNS